MFNIHFVTALIFYFSSSLRMLCDSMRRQIISRAFYGWLAHCRHIAGVRTYLTALVNRETISPHYPTDASIGVTEDVWKTLFRNGKVSWIIREKVHADSTALGYWIAHHKVLSSILSAVVGLANYYKCIIGCCVKFFYRSAKFFARK